MRIIVLCVMAILGLAASCGAQPYIVCDYPSDAAFIEYYEVDGLAPSIVGKNVPPDTSKKYGFKLDIKALPAGSYKVIARACNKLWGCSADSDPFDLARPAQLGKPKLGLTK